MYRIRNHEYFEARLDEECERGLRRSGTFVVARFHCNPPLTSRGLKEVLSSLGRASDVIGKYDTQELEFILVGAGPDEADALVTRIASELRKLASVHAGFACYPYDGRTPHELIHRASPYPRALDPKGEATISAPVVADRHMRQLYQLVELIAAGNISVLILGETGVGKELLAERIHKRSPRATKPYLKLDCAALSAALLESELFGHERGAFTSAVRTKPGLLETADGGTVFFDEIGALPMSIQVKLLRVLDARVVTRVGGFEPRAIDVRFVAATNCDLEVEVERGTFRQDLYFRINGATLVIPPLRERIGEIAELSRAFITESIGQLGLPAVPRLTSDALEALRRYSWPGNIRELRNVVARAVLLCGDNPILPSHLPLDKMRPIVPVALPVLQPVSIPLPRTPAEDSATEKQRIAQALMAASGNQSLAAQRLGIARRTLLNKLDRHRISGPRKKRDGP